MKHLITVLALAAAATSAYAADAPAKEPTKQQTKMATCNKEAEGKKGDERKAFMKTCLSNKGAGAADCETKAAEKKLAGAAKTSFTKKCMADA
jgi:hypothetical protein